MLAALSVTFDPWLFASAGALAAKKSWTACLKEGRCMITMPMPSPGSAVPREWNRFLPIAVCDPPFRDPCAFLLAKVGEWMDRHGRAERMLWVHFDLVNGPGRSQRGIHGIGC
jgi:hypothetical protein